MGTKLTEVFQNVAKEGVDRCVYRSEVTKHRHGSVFETTETYRTEPNGWDSESNTTNFMHWYQLQREKFELTALW